MRVLACGGRDDADREFLFAELSALHAATPLTLVIPRAAKGADRMAGEWAESVGVPVAAFPADWTRSRNPAGPRRNAQPRVAGTPDLVVAFPGGTGTANMMRQATAAGVPVRTVGPREVEP